MAHEGDEGMKSRAVAMWTGTSLSNYRNGDFCQKYQLKYKVLIILRGSTDGLGFRCLNITYEPFSSSGNHLLIKQSAWFNCIVMVACFAGR